MNHEGHEEHEEKTGICCPGCGCRHFVTTTTRRHYYGVKRYRQCRHCGTIVATLEKVVEVKNIKP